MMRFLRSAFVIGRRDFTATVLSKTFIFFLLAPLFPAAMGGLFGGIGAQVASQRERPVVAVVAPPTEIRRLSQARNELAVAVGDQALVKLVGYPPEPDLAAETKRLLASRDPPVRAVLSGGLNHPRLIGALGNDPATVKQLELLIEDATSSDDGQAAPELAVTDVHSSPSSLATDRVTIAWIAQAGLFMLTLLLAPMVMSQLIEEKSNKIIEVIAAAIRIDAMFIGKLFAMLTASIFALIVWIGAAALLLQTVKHGGPVSLPAPAVGWVAFLVLAIAYFAMNYLLFGAAFLMIGAQASTAREVQTLALPTTFAQMLIFGLATKSIGDPDSHLGIAAAVFPLSSPMAMFARAAQEPVLWPHLIALLWQAIWVSVILSLSALLFRKTVLKSGPRLPWWKFGRA